MVFGSARVGGEAVFTHNVVTPDGAALAEPLSLNIPKSSSYVHFSLRTHARLCLALVSALAIAGGGLILTTGRLVPHGHAAQPVMVNPANLSHHTAAPKQPRLAPQMNIATNRRISKRIDIAEGAGDGDARLYTYQHVVLDLKGGTGSLDANVSPEPSKPAQTALPLAPDQNGIPINVSLARPATASGHQVHEIVIAPQSREEMGALLQAAGVSSDDSKRLEEALARTVLVPGDNLELLIDKPAGRNKNADKTAHISLARFRHGDAAHAVYGRADDGVFHANGNERLFARLSRDAMLTAYHPQPLQPSDGSISYRLKQAGAPEAVVREVKKLASDNGISLAKNNNALNLIDLLFRKSEENAPELVYVEFNINGRSKRLYRHEGSGGVDYFNEDGSPMTKYLMHKPLPNGRLNDGFGWRIHPVLHVRKHHNGVDYDAPLGSPIVAAGDGVVDLISWQKGYGKYVRIRHQGGYSTTYAHLSAEAKGLKVGKHVKQGEVIAYVGSTGYSTGPHLYYELKVGDKYVDPLTARLNAGEKLTGSSLSSFREEISHVGKIVNEMKLPILDNGSAGSADKPAHNGQ